MNDYRPFRTSAAVDVVSWKVRRSPIVAASRSNSLTLSIVCPPARSSSRLVEATGVVAETAIVVATVAVATAVSAIVGASLLLVAVYGIVSLQCSISMDGRDTYIPDSRSTSSHEDRAHEASEARGSRATCGRCRSCSMSGHHRHRLHEACEARCNHETCGQSDHSCSMRDHHLRCRCRRCRWGTRVRCGPLHCTCSMHGLHQTSWGRDTGGNGGLRRHS